MTRRHSSNDRGMALLGMVIVLAGLMAIAAAIGTAIITDTRLRGAFGAGLTGLYAAESGLNKGMGEFRNIFLGFNVPHGSDFDAKTYTLGQRTVSYQLTERPGNPHVMTIPAGELFGGLNNLQYSYTVSSKAGVGSDTEASVGAEFLVGYIPIFQFVAFYAGDLEIIPGAEMHLHGRVHTNGELYLGANASLYIEDNPAGSINTVQVSAHGDLHRGRKDDGTCAGLVSVDMLADVVPPTPDLDPRLLPCNGSAARVVPGSEIATWNGSIVTGINNIAVPAPDTYAKGNGTFWQNADLRIVLRLNQNDQVPGGPVLPRTIEVQDANGNRDGARTASLQQFMVDAAYNANFSSFPTTMPIFYTDVPLVGGGCNCDNANPNACNNGNAACYNPAFASDARVYRSNNFDGDYRRGGFYNWREHKWMILLNINVHDLIDWNSRNGNPLFNSADTTDGGLVIFASVQGPDSLIAANNYGVRVFGSRDLPIPYVAADPTGLTFVSDQAIYVLGDYNRGNTGAGDLPKQPAALIGDSVNVLSNNYWQTNCVAACRNDAQSNGDLNSVSRQASNTTINTAFLGGIDTTTVGNYNGGLENYPRFHEDWSGFDMVYRGSFVSLGNSQHVTGPWCGTGGSLVSGCNIYNPPRRLWDYDVDFSNAAMLPPLTPRFVYVQQVVFTQDFT